MLQWFCPGKNGDYINLANSDLYWAVYMRPAEGGGGLGKNIKYCFKYVLIFPVEKILLKDSKEFQTQL